MKKVLITAITVVLMVTLFPVLAFADQSDVVTLGADLSQEQQKQILDYFGVKEDEVLILTVTNEEEREYLEGIASKEHIGTRALSSAYVKLASKGAGIRVKTHNITWVTQEMYANALVTAGVENAEINVTAPFNVSGTAALTGIMKAFEEATGKKLSSEAKEAANEELFVTGDLGDDIGKEEAAELIKKIKQEVAKDKIKNPNEIRHVIEIIAKDMNITLTDAQIEKVQDLMEKISRLDLNVEKISEQLGKIGKSLDDLKRTAKQNQGLIQKILDGIKTVFGWLKQVFSAA